MRTRRWLVAGVALGALIGGACGEGGDAPTTTRPPPDEVTSSDGLLTVSVPNDALMAPARMTVTSRTADQAPDLSDDAVTVDGAFHELSIPVGTSLGQPVRVTRIVELGEGTVATGVPLYLLVRTEPDGSGVELLTGQSVDLHGTRVVVSGLASRPGLVFAFGSGTSATLQPDRVETATGSSWEATFDVDVSAPEGTDEVLWSADGQTVVGGEGSALTTTFSCAAPGTGGFGASRGVEVIEVYRLLLGVLFPDGLDPATAASTQQVTVSATVACLEPLASG